MNGKMKMPKSIDKKFGEYETYPCCFCGRKYIKDNMMDMVNQVTYNKLTRDLFMDYEIDWDFDRACIKCFNLKIGEKNGTKDMEDGNKS
jgi:hypothetical protein